MSQSGSVKSQLFGKISTLLCYELSEKCDYFYSTSGEVLTPKKFEDYLIAVGGVDGNVTNVILVELGSSCDSKSNIFVKEILETLEITFAVNDVTHFMYVFYSNIEPDAISSGLICLNGRKDKRLVNDLNLTKIHPKLYALISSVISNNSKHWLEENQIEKNFYNIEVTNDEGQIIKLKDFFDLKSSFEEDNPIYENSELNFYNALDLSKIGFLENNDLGLFLVRDMYDPDGDRPNLMKNVETVIEKLTPKTMFFINDISTFEEVCKINENVHEVIFEHEYTLIHWSRSSKGFSVLREFLIERLVEKQKDAKENSLKIIHGTETCEKTMCLRKIYKETKAKDFSKWVCLLNGLFLEQVFEDEENNIERVLAKLLKINTKVERAVLSKSILIDDKITLLFDEVDSLPKKTFQNALNFILNLHKNYPAIKIFVTARDSLRNLLEQNCGVISHEIPELTQEQQTSLLQKLLPPLNSDEIKELELIVKKANTIFLKSEYGEPDCPFTKNPFNIFLIAEKYKQTGFQGSFTKISVYEYYLACNNLYSEDLDELAYYIFCDTEPEMTSIEFPKTNAVLSIDRYMNRSLLEFLVAKYFYYSHPEELTEDLRVLNCMKSIVDIFDKKMFKDFPIMDPVFDNNLREVKQKSIEEGIVDNLNRNPLHLVRGSPNIATLFLNSKYDVNHKDFFGWTPLRYADLYKDLRMMNYFLENGGCEDDLVKLNTSSVEYAQKMFPEIFEQNCVTLILYILNKRSDFIVTPYNVFCAATYYQISVKDRVKILNVMANKMTNKDVVYQTHWHGTALHIALKSKELELVKLLIEKFNMNFENGEDELINDLTILKYCIEDCDKLSKEQKYKIFTRACQEGQLEIIKYFIVEYKIDFFLRDAYDMNAMDHVVYTNQNIKTVKFLYELGFKDFTKLELHYACMGGNLKIIKFLVKHGANVKEQYQNKYPIDFVFKNDSMATIDFLMRSGSPMMSNDSLHSMIACNTLEYVKKFDEKYKIDWTSRNSNDYTIVQFFVVYGDDLEVMKYVVEYSSAEVINYKGKLNKTALHMAFEHNRVDMILNVLQYCCDLNAVTDDGENCMFLALSSSASFQLPEFLIEKGFDINVRNNKGQTPFHNLFYNPSQEVAFKSIKFGLNANAVDNDGKTALHYAVEPNVDNMLNRIKYCLNDLKIDPSICDNRKRLAQHYAVELGQVDVLEMFASFGELDLNAKDVDGKTPLMIAETLGGDVYNFLK